jgi:cob(I)alamin adenosyltransferase
MVYLHRIYTKTGDAGETSLGDGRRVPKTDRRIVAYGGVDELNSLLGVVRAAGVPEPYDERLQIIQNDLFDLGADLCVPASDEPASTPRLRISPEQVARLERWIDADTERLAPLTSFILPGGTPAAAYLHLARAVCRRVEIAAWELAAAETINVQCLLYLNRLSDLLFAWSRVANDLGKRDVLWVPGQSRGGK